MMNFRSNLCTGIAVGCTDRLLYNAGIFMADSLKVGLYFMGPMLKISAIHMLAPLPLPGAP
jgi:hypothetical protein